MRERTSWNPKKIAEALKKIAEDPRAMNQDHHSQQPAADKYVIGDPSDFAEDVASPTKDWKAEYGSDGNTERNEIGMPEMRDNTFNKSDVAPGESAKRAALEEVAIQRRAHLTTNIASLMFKDASTEVIESHAFDLMDLPEATLQSMYQRLAAQQQDDDDDEEEGQDQQGKQAQQQDDKGQQESKQSQQQDKDQQTKAQQQSKGQQEGQDKEAKGSVPPEFLEQQKKNENKGDDKDQGKQAQDQQQQDSSDEGEDKEASALVKAAASALIHIPVGQARNAAAQVLLFPIYKHMSSKRACTEPMAQQQLMGEVQQMVQQAMQQQMAQQQGQQVQQQFAQQQQQQAQQQMLSDEELVDQILLGQEEEPAFLAEAAIEMDTPTMDIGEVVLTAQDKQLLGQIFASEELSNALEAQAIQNGGYVPAAAPVHTARTASTRTVGTRPTAGVSTLGGSSASADAGAASGEEINKLSSMWSSSPDVSNVFG